MHIKIKALVIFCLFFYCQKEQVINTSQRQQELQSSFNQKLGNYFFDFDEIQYYTTDISEDNAMALMDNPQKTKLERLKSDIIIGDKPTEIYTIDFLNIMERMGFANKNVPSANFKDIKEIFREKTVSESYSAACIPVYRDILVFKKNNKVIGFTKICFDCKLFKIIGTQAHYDNFGQANDFEKLQGILKNIQ
ncbi:hypothetical protein [Chryseobacterium sp. T1]